MKLLGWMHHKFRQNGGDPFRDFTTGNPCNCLSGSPSLDDNHHQQYYHSKQLKLPYGQIPDRWFYSEVLEDPPIVTDMDDDQLFHGLLTIGTLGAPTDGNNPHGTATPTFGLPPALAKSVNSIAEKEEHTEATELDLMVINSELEKVLVISEGDRLSSARASHVSAKQLVVSGCPLQEYLLGSAVEMAETTTDQQRKEEKDHHHRTSLGELFMKSNLTEEGGGGGGGGGTGKKEKNAAGVLLMVKKMLKRCGSSRVSSGTSSGGGDDVLDGRAGGSENKFQKIIQMFHKKIHPKNSVAAMKAMKSAKSMNKHHEGGGGGGGTSVLVTAAPSKLLRKESVPSDSYHSISPGTASGTGSSESNGNSEQWIKTDVDYLVLEL